MIEYRRAKQSDIPMIAETHIQGFPDYFLTSLGKKLLCSFYKSYYDENNLFVVALDNGKMIGFGMGHLYPSDARRNFEKENFIQLSFRLLYLCLKLDKPTIERVIARLFKRGNTKNQLSFSHQADANWLSSTVLPEYRGQGVATQLNEEFESLLKQYNVRSYTGSVREDNDNIRGLLKKQGFSIIEDAGGKIRYLKNLDY